jgi:hypothetical protein
VAPVAQAAAVASPAAQQIMLQDLLMQQHYQPV